MPVPALWGGRAMPVPALWGRPETPTVPSGACGHAGRSRDSSSSCRSRPSERGASGRRAEKERLLTVRATPRCAGLQGMRHQPLAL
eukprot:10414839-Alexandrium_andersonii.AAC.1